MRIVMGLGSYSVKDGEAALPFIKGAGGGAAAAVAVCCLMDSSWLVGLVVGVKEYGGCCGGVLLCE